jgi:hypothetical protein
MDLGRAKYNGWSQCCHPQLQSLQVSLENEKDDPCTILYTEIIS